MARSRVEHRLLTFPSKVPLSPVKAGFAFAIVALLLACAPSVQRAPISTSISGDDSVDPSSPVGGSPGLGDDQDADPADAGLTSSGDDDAQADIDSTSGDDQAENDAFPIEGEAAVPEADPGPPFDAGEGGICPSGVGPGDLTVTELMIASMAGTGDHGEWLEVASTRDCALNVRGLHGEVPSGTKVRVVDVDDDLWIPALGTFVIADSTDPALSHFLPGTVIAWAGQPGDVLRNKGATITFLVGGQLVASLTYPALTLTIGSSLAFPADCDPSLSSDWTVWQFSTASWFPAFYGTPNAPNTDIHCVP